MTTDPSSGGGRERLRPGPATEARRAVSATRPVRRGHAAVGGRILVGSLSASAALGLMGAMAHATGPATAAQEAANPPAATAVVVIRRLAVPSDGAARVAPPVAATVAAPVATSGGS